MYESSQDPGFKIWADNRGYSYTKSNWIKYRDNGAYTSRMPAAKKTRSKNAGMKGIGARAKAKKSAANYGISKTEEKAMIRMAEKIAEKQINKNIETQYSQALVRMTAQDAVTASTGWALRGLNWQAATTGSTTRALNLVGTMIFNLGYLSQNGASVQPGYRQGQRINAKSLSFTVSATLPQITSDCTYHWRVVRRKNDAAGNAAYAVPTLTTMDVVGLFKPTTDGPLSSSITYTGYEQTTTTPIPQYVSAMRQNVDQWTFVQGAHGYQTIKAAPLDPGAADQVRTVCFCQKMYVPLEQEWDFVTRAGCDIKGGNYFFVMWREGGQDFAPANLWSQANAAAPLENINVFMELAFKDG